MKQCEIVAQNILSNVYTPISDYTEDSPKKEFALNERETIEKSHILEQFNNSLTISKKGAEIKEKLQKVLQDEQEEINSLSNTLLELKIKIVDEPTLTAQESCSWKIDGFEDKVSDLPMFYPWESCSETLKDSVEYVGESRPEEVRKMKSDYNNLASKLVDCKLEVMMLNTMIGNFEDKKVYSLNIRQAAMLGF